LQLFVARYLKTRVDNRNMCENLMQLCSYFESSDAPKARSEVIRVVCGSCNRVEVCPSVTDDEFETRSRHQEKDATKQPGMSEIRRQA